VTDKGNLGDGDVFYVLVCRECGDPEHPVPIPFGSPAERGRWASEHTWGTGHDRWFVLDQRAGEPDAVAVLKARDDAALRGLAALARFSAAMEKIRTSPGTSPSELEVIAGNLAGLARAEELDSAPRMKGNA
jgi:hypothetical protein